MIVIQYLISIKYTYKNIKNILAHKKNQESSNQSKVPIEKPKKITLSKAVKKSSSPADSRSNTDARSLCSSVKTTKSFVTVSYFKSYEFKKFIFHLIPIHTVIFIHT